MTLHSGERQVAETISNIRADHVARYKWADGDIPEGASILDIGCGVGYGSHLLAQKGRIVLGVDRDEQAIGYAKRNYPGASYQCADASPGLGGYQSRPVEYAIAFEIIEHLADPREMLRTIPAQTLYCSVPNETHFPYRNYAFHHRHYTEQQFRDLLSECGWHVAEMKHQEGPESDVGDKPGRTLVAKCTRAAQAVESDPEGLAGKHVAILGLGPSLNTFVDIAKQMGGVSAYCDEVWGVNALGDVFACNRIFHMDDVRVQEARAKAKPQSNIAYMMNWLKQHPGPIYTSHLDPAYPGLVRFPLEEIVFALRQPYFNNTVAYAVAFAIYHKVARISVYGCDYSYANSHHAERGRACLEFWLGQAAARGMQITLPRTTSLMDAIDGDDARFYGFDGYKVDIDYQAKRLTFEPRDLPTADEIERRYDHSQPSSTHVRNGVVTDES